MRWVFPFMMMNCSEIKLWGGVARVARFAGLALVVVRRFELPVWALDRAPFFVYRITIAGDFTRCGRSRSSAIWA